MRAAPAFAAAVGAMIAPALAEERALPPPSFEVVQYRLDNGLEVILQPDPTVTSVVVHVWYHVGAKDETKGKTGFAHLFEHLMFEGSKHVANGDFDRLLEAAGGWNNGTTDSDRTNYFEQVPANYLELALYLEADRMAGLWDAMDEGDLENQREVVKNEHRDDVENQPYGQADVDVQLALWPEGHGNHNLVIGHMEDLEAATLDDVGAFWRKWYVPSNATLVVCGGIDAAATRALIEKYFAWMPSKPRPEARALDGAVVPREAPAELEGTDQVEAPKVIVAWRTDAPDTDASVDLGVAAQLLGGGRTSRLYRRLVFDDRLASDVSTYHYDQVLGGELHIEAIARDGVTPEQLRAAIDEEVAALRDDLATAAEVTRALRVLESERLEGLENLASRAEALAEWAATTGDPDHLAEELERLRAVTPERVRDAANTWLRADAAVTMIVRPEGTK